MRYDEGLTYQEYKDGVHDAMNLLGDKNYETAEKVTDYMTDEDNDMLRGTSLALWIISIGEYEVRHDILEERVLAQLSYHIPQFHAGKYTADLSKEEYDQVKADVEYIESKVTLYEEVELCEGCEEEDD